MDTHPYQKINSNEFSGKKLKIMMLPETVSTILHDIIMF